MNVRPAARLSSLNIMLIALVLLLGVAALFQPLAQVLLLSFAGLLFGIFLDAVMRPLMRIGAPRILALLVVLICLVAIVTGFLLFFGSSLVEQLQSLASTLDSQAKRVIEALQDWDLLRPAGKNDKAVEAILPAASSVVGKTASAALVTVGFLGNAAIIVAIGAFIAASPQTYRDSVASFVRQVSGKEIGALLDRMGHTLRIWLVARGFDMAVIAVLMAAGLWLIGVPQSLLLGLLAGLLAFIPNIGPILAAVPIFVAALTVSAATLAWAFVLYIVVQTVESYLLTPIVQRHAVHIFPAFLLIAQILMASLFGMLGLAVATPLAAIALVLYREITKKEQVSDS